MAGVFSSCSWGPCSAGGSRRRLKRRYTPSASSCFSVSWSSSASPTSAARREARGEGLCPLGLPLAVRFLGEHPAVSLEILHPVLASALVILRLAEDLRAAPLSAPEMRVDVVDVDDYAIDDVGRLEPLTCQGAGLSVSPRALIRVTWMADQHLCAVEIEHHVGHRARAIVEALDFAEPEDLRYPIGGATSVLIREHRDHALLWHSRPPELGSQQMMHSPDSE